jgi:hypothetical protein
MLMDENKYRYYASRFKVVLQLLRLVTLTVHLYQWFAVPDAAPV